jgi:hypothetical protein
VSFLYSNILSSHFEVLSNVKCVGPDSFLMCALSDKRGKMFALNRTLHSRSLCIDPKLLRFWGRVKCDHSGVGTGYLHAADTRISIQLQVNNNDVITKTWYSCCGGNDNDAVQMAAGAASWCLQRTLGEALLVRNDCIRGHLQRHYSIVTGKNFAVEEAIRDACNNVLSKAENK